MALPPEEIARRLEAIKRSLANVELEGGQLDRETRKLLENWAQGTMTEQQVIEALDAKHREVP